MITTSAGSRIRWWLPVVLAAAGGTMNGCASKPAASATAPEVQSVQPIVARSPEGGDGGTMSGTEPTGPVGPAPRDAVGHPDLTGYWKPIREKGKPGGNLAKDLPDFQLPLTEAGKTAQQYNRTQTIDPEALCILGGIPRHDASGLPFEVLQTPKRIAFLYLYSTHRYIPVDGRSHDQDADPRFFGNPIGNWEGDTLVIDTTAIKDQKIWADENADPQSDAMHTIERWTRPDAEHIHLQLIVDDPKFYTQQFEFDRTWIRGKPGEGLTEYSCAENNIDAKHIGPGPGVIGADGNRGADIPKTLPDNPPPPEFYENKK
jgi:hypothetical protein